MDVDLKEFYECIYENLLRVPEEIDSVPQLMHCMRLMVSENRTVSAERAAAFCKRLATISLYFPTNGAIASLVTLQRLMTFHPPVRQLLEVSEDRANDSYRPMLDSPDNCKALASTLWELNVLEVRCHSCTLSLSLFLPLAPSLTPMRGAISLSLSPCRDCD